MLFDLRSGKRKRVIQVTYAVLAFLMAASLFTVVGPLNIGDIFTGGGGSSDAATSQFDDQISAAEDKLAKNPKDEKALLDLARNEALKGRAESQPSSVGAPPEITDEARTDFGRAADAWERYLKVSKGQPDASTAVYVVQAYVSLNDAAGAARTQEIVAQAQPSASSYGNLAIYRYFEGDFAGGDEAAKQALAEANPSEKKQISDQLDQVKKQAQQAAKQQKKAAQSSTGQNPLQSPLSPLGGTGVTPPGG